MIVANEDVVHVVGVGQLQSRNIPKSRPNDVSMRGLTVGEELEYILLEHRHVTGEPAARRTRDFVESARHALSVSHGLEAFASSGQSYL